MGQQLKKCFAKPKSEDDKKGQSSSANDAQKGQGVSQQQEQNQQKQQDKKQDQTSDINKNTTDASKQTTEASKTATDQNKTTTEPNKATTDHSKTTTDPSKTTTDPGKTTTDPSKTDINKTTTDTQQNITDTKSNSTTDNLKNTTDDVDKTASKVDQTKQYQPQSQTQQQGAQVPSQTQSNMSSVNQQLQPVSQNTGSQNQDVKLSNSQKQGSGQTLVYIILQSFLGYSAQMAEAVKKGLEHSGHVRAKIFQVEESVHQEDTHYGHHQGDHKGDHQGNHLGEVHHAEAHQGEAHHGEGHHHKKHGHQFHGERHHVKLPYPVISNPNDLEDADGILFGFESSVCTYPESIKAFCDKCSHQWATQSLYGKPAGLFVCSKMLGDAQESAALNLMPFLAHQGMLFVPLGYKSNLMFENVRARGSSAWNSGSVSGLRHHREPSKDELELATVQGSEFAKVAHSLKS